MDTQQFLANLSNVYKIISSNVAMIYRRSSNILVEKNKKTSNWLIFNLFTLKISSINILTKFISTTNKPNHRKNLSLSTFFKQRGQQKPDIAKPTPLRLGTPLIAFLHFTNPVSLILASCV